jgi:hypothetical protein
MTIPNPTIDELAGLRANLLGTDVTGDELLWVFRYCSYFCSVTGMALSDAIPHANGAWLAWGCDPDTTPEEIASSDIHCLREEQ